jgi:hypothetical protein
VVLLAWCAERWLHLPSARRAHLELYIRGMQKSAVQALLGVAADLGSGTPGIP